MDKIEFYQIVAQVIPALFLAISLQSNFYVRKEEYSNKENFQRNVHIMVFLCFVLLLVIGEFVALRAVYLSSPLKNDLFVVVFSMMSAVIYIGTQFVLALLNKEKSIFIVGFMIIGILANILLFYSVLK